MLTHETAPFHAVLFPHRSLSRRGFVVLMVIVGGTLGVAALRTLALGAWPVAVFSVLDILLVWGAFHLSYRSGKAFEEVTVTQDEVVVRKVSPGGRVSEHRFHTAWARITINRREEEVVRLRVGSHGRSIVIGDFLNPGDRATFADAFAHALIRSKRGV